MQHNKKTFLTRCNAPFSDPGEGRVSLSRISCRDSSCAFAEDFRQNSCLPLNGAGPPPQQALPDFLLTIAHHECIITDTHRTMHNKTESVRVCLRRTRATPRNSAKDPPKAVDTSVRDRPSLRKRGFPASRAERLTVTRPSARWSGGEPDGKRSENRLALLPPNAAAGRGSSSGRMRCWRIFHCSARSADTAA